MGLFQQPAGRRKHTRGLYHGSTGNRGDVANPEALSARFTLFGRYDRTAMEVRRIGRFLSQNLTLDEHADFGKQNAL